MAANIPIPKMPQHGMPISADWGRDVVKCLEMLRPRSSQGFTIDQNLYGTRLSMATSSPALQVESDYAPFSVRYRITDVENNKGEFQIYIPFGSAVVTQDGLAQACEVHDLKQATGEDGEALYGWYTIPADSMKDKYAEIMSHRVYEVKMYPVYVLMKPWPEMTASCDPTVWGAVKWSEIVAYIGMIKIDGREEVGVVNQIFTGNIKREWNASGKFAIVYTPATESEGGGKYKMRIRNANLMIGRLMLSIPESEGEDGGKDISGWEEVWLKIIHDSEKVSMELLDSNSGEESDDDKTICKLYTIKDDVVISDSRENASNDFGFYTQIDESVGNDD